MSYKARHAATPKYVTYARATGASIAAMAVLTAVPAVAVETDAPLGDVGETTPIAQPEADAVDTDALGAFTTFSDQAGAAADSGDEPDLLRDVAALAKQFSTIDTSATLAGEPPTPTTEYGAVVQDLTLRQGGSKTIDVATLHPAAALATFTFDNPHDAAGVHVTVKGTKITVSVDKDTKPGPYTITGAARALGVEQKAKLNLTVAPAPSPATSTTGTPAPAASPAPTTPATPAPSSANPKTVDLTAVAGGDFVAANTLASSPGSTLKITSALPAGVQSGDLAGAPTFEAAPTAKPGTYTITVTETLADGATINHTVNLTVVPAGTAPETNTKPGPGTGNQTGTANLAWAAGTNVVQGTTATVKFTGTHGAVKPARYETDAIYAENGAQMNRGAVVVDPATGTATIAPSWDLEPGQYTATISGIYADGSRETGQLNFTVTAGKLSDRYTPTVAPAYIGTNPDRVVYSKVNFGNTPAPFGVTYTVNDKNNVVEVGPDGTVSFRPNPDLTPGEYTAQITVHYPVADGVDPDTDTVAVRYSVGDTFQALRYRLVTDKRTVTRRESVTIGVPHDADRKPLPGDLMLERGRDWPEWVMLNSDGTLTATPDLNVKPGTYVFTSLATFPDQSTGEVTNTIEVSGAYKTQGFKYKRKDGVGATVGRAIDKALGTEKPGSAAAAAAAAAVRPVQPGQPEQTGQPAGDTTAATDGTTGTVGGDTETAGTTAATPTDNMVAAPAEVTVTDPTATGTRGATALQTTGADSDGLLGAGVAAGGFALAAAAAFALRRRERESQV